MGSPAVRHKPERLPPPESTTRRPTCPPARPCKSPPQATPTPPKDLVVSLTPGNSAVELGAAQGFRATVSSAGRPDTTVRWSILATSCPIACGAVDAGGNYTAPQILPANPTVIITATSVADPSRQSSASISITSSFALILAAPTNLSTSATAALVATLTPLPGSNPNPGLSWSLSGSGCSAAACGILQVTTTQSAGAAKVDDTANYTAPPAAPQPDLVTVTVTSLADPTKKAQANIAIQPGSGLSISPITATLSANHRIKPVPEFFGRPGPAG
jgi:hypothetical protein